MAIPLKPDVGWRSPSLPPAPANDARAIARDAAIVSFAAPLQKEAPSPAHSTSLNFSCPPRGAQSPPTETAVPWTSPHGTLLLSRARNPPERYFSEQRTGHILSSMVNATNQPAT